MKLTQTSKTVGEHKHFDACRLCGSNNIQIVTDLGLMPLAGGFIKNIRQKNEEKFYPLQLTFCRDCFLLQANYVIRS